MRKSLEEMKLKCMKLKDYRPRALMAAISGKASAAWVPKASFCNFLGNVELEDVDLLFRQYDSSGNCDKLSYGDVCRLLMPKNNGIEKLLSKLWGEV
jgi:hypothetical protein